MSGNRKLKEFCARARTSAVLVRLHGRVGLDVDMNPTDREQLALILEEFERRLVDLEMATDPHRMAGYD